MSGASNLEAALDLARRGGMVLPVCWPDAGLCACPGLWDYKTKRMVPHQGKDVGKAPFAKGGYTAATSDPEQITSIWTKHPQANVGLWLEGSRMAAIDPDSELAAAEAHKLGMPPRPVRHSRHRAFLFALPDGCPIERSIHGGSDGKLDILSEGLLIAHGRHQNGHDVYIDWNGLITELSPLPAWAVQKLVARDTERNANKGPVGEPGLPTSLSEREVIERAKANPKRGGLFTKLYDDGAPNLIGACPCEPPCATVCPHTSTCTEQRCPAKCMVVPYASESERDLALMNFLRFWGGADPERMELLFGFSAPGQRPKWQGSASYRKATVTKALAGKVWKPATEREAPAPEPTPLEKIETSGSDGGDLVCISRAEYDRLRDAAQRLDQIKAIIANPGMKPGPKLLGVAVVVELERRQDWSRSKLESMIGLPDGYHCVSRGRLGAAAGMSEDSVDRHLDTLAQLGILQARTAGLPKGKPDVMTGKILDRPQRFTGLRLLTPAGEAFDRLATAQVTPIPKPKREPGTCDDHPLAGTVLKARKSLHCEVCNGQLAQSPQIAVTSEDATLSSIPPPVVIGTPQVAVTREKKIVLALETDIRLDDQNAEEIAARFDDLYRRGKGEAPPPEPISADASWWDRERQASTNWAELDQGHRPFAPSPSLDDEFDQIIWSAGVAS